MYIPDLFGAYVKGRELAIEKNWQDLKNFESVEAARNQNDLSAMDIWERRQQMPGKMSMFYNQARSSDLAMEVMNAAQRGRLAQANMGSDVAVGQYGVYKAYEPQYIQALGDMFGAKIGEQSNAAQALLGKNAYLAPHAFQIGQDQGYIGHQQVLANKTTAGNLVNAANQQIAISNGNAANAIAGNQLQGMQIRDAISNQPLVQANTVDALGRVIPARNAIQAQIAAANTGAMTNAQIGSLISLAQQGDAGAAWQLKQAGYNIDGSLLSAQATQDLMGTGGQTQTTPAATTPNTTPQTVNINGKTVTTHPSGVVVTSNGQTSFMMTPAEAQRRAAAASLVPPTQNPNPSLPTITPPSSNPNSVMNLANGVGSSYLPAWQVVP